jgi:hypothetical protein
VSSSTFFDRKIREKQKETFSLFKNKLRNFPFPPEKRAAANENIIINPLFRHRTMHMHICRDIKRTSRKRDIESEKCFVFASKNTRDMRALLEIDLVRFQ